MDRPGWARLRSPALRHLRLRPRRAVGQDQPLLLRGRLAAVRARPRGRRRAARRLRGPAGRHPRRPRPGADLRGPRRRGLRELRGRPHQPLLADHRRPPVAGAADRLLQGHRRRLGPAAGRAPQPDARRARGLLRRAGAADRAGRVRGAHRAARRRASRTTGCWSAAPARSGCSPPWRCASSPRPARSSWSPSTATSASWRSSSARPRSSQPDEVLRRVRRSTGAFQLKPEFSAPYLLGGVDVAVDAVGSKQSLETALHATRAGGRVVLSGMPAAGRPVRGVVPRARGGRHLRLVRSRSPTAAGAFDIAAELVAHDARRPARQVRRQLPAAPVARGPRPCPRGRPARYGQGRVRPKEHVSESPRFRARGRRPDPAAGRPRGARVPAGELPARHPRRLPAGVAPRGARRRRGDPRRAAAPARLRAAAGAAQGRACG